MDRPRRRFSAEWVPLLLVIAIATALRFWDLGTTPPGLYHDEAFNGLDALGVLEGERPVFFEANNGREPLFIYLVALSVAALGRSPGAIRIVAALLGTLTIPATYLMAKAMFNRRSGLLAAALPRTTILCTLTSPCCRGASPLRAEPQDEASALPAGWLRPPDPPIRLGLGSGPSAEAAPPRLIPLAATPNWCLVPVGCEGQGHAIETAEGTESQWQIS